MIKVQYESKPDSLALEPLCSHLYVPAADNPAQNKHCPEDTAKAGVWLELSFVFLPLVLLGPSTVWVLNTEYQGNKMPWTRATDPLHAPRYSTLRDRKGSGLSTSTPPPTQAQHLFPLTVPDPQDSSCRLRCITLVLLPCPVPTSAQMVLKPSLQPQALPTQVPKRAT